jgi:VRR-NUC domain-containing protein
MSVRLTEQQRADRELSELDLQRQIKDLSAMYGWLHVHIRAAQTEKGWRTPISGQLGKGWVDLVLVNPMRRRTLAVEVKRETGELSADQMYVHTMLRESGWQVEVWRPSDMTSGRIPEELAR